MIRRRKPLSAEQRSAEEERYLDRRGFAYADRHLLVPARTSDWPKYPPRVKVDSGGAQGEFHWDFKGMPCWICGIRSIDTKYAHELHHLFAGSRGRSHERELFTYLCHECHENISPDDLGKLLWAKWRYDREWCDWEWLTIRQGYHLPELEIPEWAK